VQACLETNDMRVLTGGGLRWLLLRTAQDRIWAGAGGPRGSRRSVVPSLPRRSLFSGRLASAFIWTQSHRIHQVK